MSAHTSDDLIRSVRVRGMFPDASKGSYSAANILMIASEELRMKLVPMIMTVREKYYETYVDYDMTVGQSLYDIPARASGGIASLVQFVLNQYVVPLQPMDPVNQVTTNTGTAPQGFWFENDKIVIYPTPNVSQGVIRIRYYQRPSLLIQTNEAAQVQSVDQVSKSITVRAVPQTWASGIEMDFISGKNPYTPYGLDCTIDSLSTPSLSDDTTIAFVDALPLDDDGALAVKVGDWICPSDYTPIPEVMAEFFPILAQMTACKLMEATKDLDGLATAKASLNEMMQAAVKMITPRDQFGLKKVKSDWRNW